MRRSVTLLATSAMLLLCAGVSSTTAVAATGPRPGDTYVALGSSFAAGPNIPDTIDPACGRSSNNYAHVVAAKLELQLTDASCGGATTQTVTESQLAALAPATRYVSITIGGNDVSYSASTIICSEAGKLGSSCLGNGVDRAQTATLMGALEGKLITLLEAIKQRAPEARIFLVAYPAVVPRAGTPCPPSVPMTPGDTAFIAETGAQLQRHFKAAAKQAKVVFVDTYTPSKGHDACAPPRSRWVEGATPATPAFVYHPNARGMAAEAALVIKAMRSPAGGSLRSQIRGTARSRRDRRTSGMTTTSARLDSTSAPAAR